MGHGWSYDLPILIDIDGSTTRSSGLLLFSILIAVFAGENRPEAGAFDYR
jgi:hypothetical protein